MRTLETDYLVVGCGAAGMAFTDSLIANSDAEVVMVDRRHAPGGHWLDAYPFVRLHQPAAYYGVSSLPLGDDSIDSVGPNAGMYEQAGAAEICAYFDRVMRKVLLPSGTVRYFPMSQHVGGHRFVSHASGEQFEVTVRRAVVDAAYLEPSVPATFAPPFEVAPGVRCMPVGQLTGLTDQPDRYVVIGAGKTAIDACLWLLQVGVAPDDIRWVKPREAWLRNRWFGQGGELVGNVLEGLARQLEAAAGARSVEDLFHRLETAEQVFRVDQEVVPTMYKAPTMSAAELDDVRRIEDVVRLGHVQRIEGDRLVLDRGSVPVDPGDLYVHCAAPGLNPAPTVPIFAPGRITVQPVRTGLIPFNSALIGFLESTGRDLAEKNRLCPPNRLPDVPLDWIRGTLIDLTAERLWSGEPDVATWLERTRLNVSRGLRQHRGDPEVRAASQRFADSVRPGLASLARLLEQPVAVPG